MAKATAKSVSVERSNGISANVYVNEMRQAEPARMNRHTKNSKSKWFEQCMRCELPLRCILSSARSFIHSFAMQLDIFFYTFLWTKYEIRFVCRKTLSLYNSIAKYEYELIVLYIYDCGYECAPVWWMWTMVWCVLDRHRRWLLRLILA